MQKVKGSARVTGRGYYMSAYAWHAEEVRKVSREWREIR
jgi:hypothetical protein